MSIRTVSKADEGGIITLSKASRNRNRWLTVRYGYDADLQTSGEQRREFTYTVVHVILAVNPDTCASLVWMTFHTTEF